MQVVNPGAQLYLPLSFYPVQLGAQLLCLEKRETEKQAAQAAEKRGGKIMALQRVRSLYLSPLLSPQSQITSLLLFGQTKISHKNKIYATTTTTLTKINKK